MEYSNALTCLQRNIKTNKNIINNRCNKSKWYLKPNGKYFNIISTFAIKCLTKNNNKLKN